MRYPLVNSHSFGNWPFAVDLTWNTVIFPSFASLRQGRWSLPRFPHVLSFFLGAGIDGLWLSQPLVVVAKLVPWSEGQWLGIRGFPDDPGMKNRTECFYGPKPSQASRYTHWLTYLNTNFHVVCGAKALAASCYQLPVKDGILCRKWLGISQWIVTPLVDWCHSHKP